jgi:hypothetical protein
MPENNQEFSWLNQLQNFLNNPINSVGDLTNSVLSTVSETLNPEAPKSTKSKAHNSGEETPYHSPIITPEDQNSTALRIKKEVIYDKVYKDFIFNYERSADSFPPNSSRYDAQKLRGEFNSILIKKCHNKNLPNDLEILTKLENPNASFAFSTTVTRLSKIENLDNNHLASIKEFELLLTNQQDLHTIIAKKYYEQDLSNKEPQNPNPQDPLTFEEPTRDLEKTIVSKFPQVFLSHTSFKNYLFTATTFLTSATSYLASFIIGPYKIPDSQSEQNSVKQNTAKVPTGSQIPGTSPAGGKYTTRIVPMNTTKDFNEGHSI